MPKAVTPAPFDLFNEVAPAVPIVVSVPHAGRDYPDLADQLAVPLAKLRPLEDRYADLLIEPIVRRGVTAIVARTPRLWIDLNRSETDLDRAMVSGGRISATPQSARVRGGLGLIPRSLQGINAIWRAPLAQSDVAARIEHHHRAYHRALASLLTRVRARFGCALLIDLHSMPPLGRADAPSIVIGDRWGVSAAANLTGCAENMLTRSGFRVALNAPYAGGHILEAHAAPARGIHAIQIEVDRRLYLDRDFDSAGPGLARIQATLAELIDALASELAPPAAQAAE